MTVHSADGAERMVPLSHAIPRAIAELLPRDAAVAREGRICLEDRRSVRRMDRGTAVRLEGPRPARRREDRRMGDAKCRARLRDHPAAHADAPRAERRSASCDRPCLICIEAVIVSAVRTATGKFLGSLKGFTAPQLGALVVAEAVRRAGIDPAIVDECIMGNVVSAGLGQNPARQAALRGGLADHVAALTINKVCGSGLKAVMLAAQGIATGDIDVAVAGGMESMSNCPYLLPRVREGLRMGNGEIVDSMINDGLWCAFEDDHMGNAGEVVAERYHVGREAQDAFAARSHAKAARRHGRRAVHGRDPAGCDSAEERRRRWCSIATNRFAPTRPSASLARA